MIKLQVQNTDFEVENLELLEFDIDTALKFDFLNEHPDYCLIGDGNVMICTLMNQVEDSNDFNIYVLGKIFLKNLQKMMITKAQQKVHSNKRGNVSVLSLSFCEFMGLGYFGNFSPEFFPKKTSLKYFPST
jgi:hypothetical protein